jgi:hypothetical protein
VSVGVENVLKICSFLAILLKKVAIVVKMMNLLIFGLNQVRIFEYFTLSLYLFNGCFLSKVSSEQINLVEWHKKREQKRKVSENENNFHLM